MVANPGAQIKLHQLTERFQGLERQVQADLKAKVNSEVSTLQFATGRFAHLEEALHAEVRRRGAAFKALQVTSEAQLAVVQEKLEGLFLERYESIQSSVDSLSDRMDTVEKDFLQSRERYIHEMKDKSAAVEKDLVAFQSAFEQDVLDRRKRETALLESLRGLVAMSSDKLRQEIEICDHKFSRLHSDLQDSKRTREDAQASYEAAVREQVELLRKEIASEAATREQADDDIVNALNHYTKALQDAMRSVSRQALEAADSNFPLEPMRHS